MTTHNIEHKTNGQHDGQAGVVQGGGRAAEVSEVGKLHAAQCLQSAYLYLVALTISAGGRRESSCVAIHRRS
jgi:hypothetical protein